MPQLGAQVELVLHVSTGYCSMVSWGNNVAIVMLSLFGIVAWQKVSEPAVRAHRLACAGQLRGERADFEGFLWSDPQSRAQG